VAKGELPEGDARTRDKDRETELIEPRIVEGRVCDLDPAE